MKTPIDIVRGKIVDVDEHGVMTIKAKYDDWRTMLRRDYKECNIQMIDSRPLSDKQRRTCYKLLREISNFTGMGIDPTKEYLKLKFLAEDLQVTADHIFSLSSAPMSLVCAFQRFLHAKSRRQQKSITKRSRRLATVNTPTGIINPPRSRKPVVLAS